jgi:hypothetical protein
MVAQQLPVLQRIPEGTLSTSWTNWNTGEGISRRNVCRGKQDSIVRGPCTTSWFEALEKGGFADDETDRRNCVRRLGALAEEPRTPIYAWTLAGCLW